MSKFIDEMLQTHLQQLESRKSDLIKEKLLEKGFGYLIEGLEKRRFPKICQVAKGGWTYVYADNDTDTGAFIVAFRDYNFNEVMDSNNFSVKMEMWFEWQDHTPLVEYKQNKLQ